MSPITNLVELHAELNAAWVRHCPMPDDVCNNVCETVYGIVSAIIAAPAPTAADVAAKFRFLAQIIENRADSTGRRNTLDHI